MSVIIGAAGVAIVAGIVTMVVFRSAEKRIEHNAAFGDDWRDEDYL